MQMTLQGKYKKYYIIIIVIACAILYFCTLGLNLTAFTVYFPYIKNDYGLINIQVSLINTLKHGSAAVFLMFMRLYYQRFSLRLGMTLSLLISAVSFFMLSAAQGPGLIYIASIAMGFCFAAGTTLPITLLLHNWSVTHFSIAFGLITASSGLSTFVASPLIARSIDQVGLSATFMREGFFVVICTVIFFVIVKERPRLDSSDNNKDRVIKTKNNGVAAFQKKTLKTKCSKSLIVFIIISLMVGTFTSTCLTSYTIHFTLAGYRAVSVAAFMSIYGLALIPSKISFGLLADRFCANKINFIYFGLFLVGAVCVLLQGRYILFVPLLYFSATCVGLGNGISTAGLGVWANELSSEQNLERNVRFSQTFFSIGQIVGATITGVFADWTGDYSLSFTCVIIMVCFIFIAIQRLYKKGEVD